ncbi:MAG: hypothetical protein EXR80_09635 [Methylococcales bacterium]|nr:hypothetical protein [Methylococcales bacterium]
MKIQNRLLLLMLFNTTFVMVIALFVASYLTRDALESAAKDKLAVVLESREHALKSWTTMLQAQMTVLATTPRTVSLLTEFSTEFQHLGDTAQVVLQQNYLTVGNRQNTQTQRSTEAYDNIHRVAQPFFMTRHDAYEWEDMYLIDAQGNVVFSLKKESDFATNLHTGPWRDSGLAHVVI